MTATERTENKQRLESIRRAQLKNDQLSLPIEEQVNLLHKKKRKQLWFLLVNILAILFFCYSFFYGITQLSATIFYILAAVFLLNVALILYQRSQIRELIDYLENQNETTG